jgi:MFS family permease
MNSADRAATRNAAVEGRQAPNAWRVLVLLAMANVLNFYDRTIPAILVEEIKREFGLNDSQIGVLSGIFIVVYAVAGVALGRMADRGSRRRIMGVGLIVWSVMTALSGGVWSFASLLLVRLGVGIGEASYAPAANSTIADLFPVSKRARAVAIFQLGIPVGLILAFFTTGAIVDAFDSWRAPFFIAAVPGLFLAVSLLRMDEPERGASEVVRMGAVDGAASRALSIPDAVRAVWAIRTMRWLILSGVGVQLAAYSVSTFLVPLFQRYHGLSLTEAGISAGVVLGFTGLAGLFLGGWAADRASRRSLRSRVMVGAIALGVASPLSLFAFSVGPDELGLFISVMSVAWLLQFFFHTSALPAVSDVVEPALRSTAIAVFFALFYLLGGAFGPVITGVLSDVLAAGDAAGGVSAEAHGLRLALLIVTPTSLLLAAAGLFGAARHVERDHEAVLARTT